MDSSNLNYAGKRMRCPAGSSSIVAGCGAGGSIAVDSSTIGTLVAGDGVSFATVDPVHHFDTILVVHPDYAAYDASMPLQFVMMEQMASLLLVHLALVIFIE